MFYAQRTPYGARTASARDALVRFETKAARDEWVKAAWTNCDHADEARRDEITRKQARRWYPAAFKDDTGVFPRTNAAGDYWDTADDDGAQEWSGAPTGGIYSEI